MASFFPSDNVAELKEAFTLFDTDGDGLISSADIGKVMRQLGCNPTEAEVADLVRMVDTEGKGSIDFEGFLAMVQQQDDGSNAEDELRAAFRMFDKDGNDFIAAADLRAILTQMGETLTDEELNSKAVISPKKMIFELSIYIVDCIKLIFNLLQFPVDDMMAAADSSGTGKIVFDDFIAMMTSK